MASKLMDTLTIDWEVEAVTRFGHGFITSAISVSAVPVPGGSVSVGDLSEILTDREVFRIWKREDDVARVDASDVRTLVTSLLRRGRIQVDESNVDSFLEMIAVPVFGSPPERWTNLAELAKAGAPLVVATAAWGPLGGLMYLAGMIILIRIVDPVAHSVGEGLSRAVRRWLDEDSTT